MTGRSAREVRLMLEKGEVGGIREGGRWFVEREDLHRLAPPPARPPAEAGLRVVHSRSSEGSADLLARLDEAAAEAAGLRAERDQLRAQRDELRAERGGLRAERDGLLERSREELRLESRVEEVTEELQRARARVAELEASGFDGSLRSTGSRDALTPLFRPTDRSDAEDGA